MPTYKQIEKMTFEQLTETAKMLKCQYDKTANEIVNDHNAYLKREGKKSRIHIKNMNIFYKLQWYLSYFKTYSIHPDCIIEPVYSMSPKFSVQ